MEWGEGGFSSCCHSLLPAVSWPTKCPGGPETQAGCEADRPHEASSCPPQARDATTLNCGKPLPTASTACPLLPLWTRRSSAATEVSVALGHMSKEYLGRSSPGPHPWGPRTRLAAGGLYSQSPGTALPVALHVTSARKPPTTPTPVLGYTHPHFGLGIVHGLCLLCSESSVILRAEGDDFCLPGLLGLWERARWWQVEGG